jgi:hypothetical protein
MSTLAGIVRWPPITTPERKALNAASEGTLSTNAQYVFSTCLPGFNNAAFQRASSLNNNKPSLSASNLPIGHTPPGKPKLDRVSHCEPDSGVN